MQIALQGQPCRSPAETATRDEGMDMQGEGLNSGFSPWFPISVGDRGGVQR